MVNVSQRRKKGTDLDIISGNVADLAVNLILDE